MMPRYLVKFSMAGFWEQEMEGENIDDVLWDHEAFDVADEPLRWDDFSIDSVVNLETGEETEIVSTFHGKELPNRYKGEEQ
jgi:hypothetical protein